MSKLAALILAATAFAAPLAHAQAPAKVDPKTVEAVREMLAATNYRNTAAQMMTQMAAQMPELMKSTAVQMLEADASLNDAERKEALALVDLAMPDIVAATREMMEDPKLADEMVEMMPALYARYFTAEEVRELHRFYTTRTGAKFLSAMPQVAAESMMLGQKIVEPRVQLLYARVEKIMKDVATKHANAPGK